MNQFYISFGEYYYDKLNTVMKEYDIELIVYDETEYF